MSRRMVRLFHIIVAMASWLPMTGEAQVAPSPQTLRLVLPPVVYAVVGLPINIHYDNIVLTEKPQDYDFRVQCDLGRTERRRWTTTPAASDVGDHQISVSVRDSKGNLIERAKSILHVAPAGAGEGRTIRLLMVGDSLTHQTSFPNEVARLLSLPGNPAWAMLGTHRTAEAAKGVLHEGYGGWTWEKFVNSAPANSDRGSPFVFAVDSGKSVLDLPRYFQTACNGQQPDFVTFLLGSNDCFYVDPENPAAIDACIDSMFIHAEKLIAAFRKAAPAADLAICLPTPPNARESGFEASYHGQYHRWGFKRIQHRLVQRELEHFDGRQKERIYIVPTELSLDPVDGYPTDNGLHPNTSGYEEMGSNVFAWLKSRLEASPR